MKTLATIADGAIQLKIDQEARLDANRTVRAQLATLSPAQHAQISQQIAQMGAMQ